MTKHCLSLFRRQSGRLWLSLFATVCASTVLAQQPQLETPSEDSRVMRIPLESGGPEIRQTTNLLQPDRPLPPEISKMPGVQEELEVVHHRSQLIIARGNITRTAVADPSVVEIVQYSPNEISLIGLGLGSTTVHLWFENGTDPLVYLVRTIRDPGLDEQRRIDYGRLERKLAVLFPNSKVYLIPLSGKIVVKGQARDGEEAARILQIVRGEVLNQYGALIGPQPNSGASAAAATAAGAGYFGGAYGGAAGGAGVAGGDVFSSYIVNMLEVPGEYQVMVHVTIAELNRSQLRRMGVDLSYLINGGRHAIASFAGGLPSTLTGIFENGEVGVLINFLASNGTAKILSEPVLTVMSGHPASFLAGGEFAVPTVVGIGGAQGQTTSFRGFGTSIAVTPTVVDNDLIRMTIVPEFSQINPGNAVNGIPGLNSRRVTTTVELREGQTIALAGLYSTRFNTEVTRIPLLGEIPIIGAKLFAGKEATQDESELLILVTPELVRPMDADEVPPVPGHYVTAPDDCALYGHGFTEMPDTEVYQLAPYGRGNGRGVPVGYNGLDGSGFGFGPVASGAFGGFPTTGYNGYPNAAPGGFSPTPVGGPNGYAPNGYAPNGMQAPNGYAPNGMGVPGGFAPTPGYGHPGSGAAPACPNGPQPGCAVPGRNQPTPQAPGAYPAGPVGGAVGGASWVPQQGVRRSVSMPQLTAPPVSNTVQPTGFNTSQQPERTQKSERKRSRIPFFGKK